MYVVARGIGSTIGLRRGVDNVSEDLNEFYGMLVIER